MSLLVSGRLPWQGRVSGQERTPAGAPSLTPAGRGVDTGPFHPKHREPLASLSSLTREAWKLEERWSRQPVSISVQSAGVFRQPGPARPCLTPASPPQPRRARPQHHPHHHASGHEAHCWQQAG